MAESKTKKKGLGKGLGALFSEPSDDIVAEIEKAGSEGEEIKILPIIDIEPNKNQPRKAFDEEKLIALSDSIKEHGVVAPLLVTPTSNGTYRIVAGERRWRASKLAGLTEVPCIVRDFEDQKVMELALVENLQREDLNPIEEAEGYRRLMNTFDLTQDEVSKKVGKSRSAVANALRLNNLCDEVKEMLKDGQLTQGHARALLTLNEKTQLNVAQRIIENDLNVRQAEVLARNASEEKKTPSKKTSNPMTQKYYKEIEGSLSSKFGTKVKISEGTKKGKIEIEYYSKDDLERILFELKK